MSNSEAPMSEEPSTPHLLKPLQGMFRGAVGQLWVPSLVVAFWLVSTAANHESEARGEKGRV